MPLRVSWQIRQILNLNIYNAIVCFLANTTNIELKYLQCHCMLHLQHSKLRIVKIFCLPECSPRHRQPRWVYQQAWNNRSWWSRCSGRLGLGSACTFFSWWMCFLDCDRKHSSPHASVFLSMISGKKYGQRLPSILRKCSAWQLNRLELPSPLTTSGLVVENWHNLLRPVALLGPCPVWMSHQIANSCPVPSRPLAQEVFAKNPQTTSLKHCWANGQHVLSTCS